MAAIKRVRSLSQKKDGEYDMRAVMSSFVGKLNFREMCVVLKEQKGWKQVRDFFSWMKLQVGFSLSLSYVVKRKLSISNKFSIFFFLIYLLAK